MNYQDPLTEPDQLTSVMISLARPLSRAAEIEIEAQLGIELVAVTGADYAVQGTVSAVTQFIREHALPSLPFME